MTAVGTDLAPVAVRSLSGIQKAALVLMNMSTERAAAVLRNFDPTEAEEITAEMSRMRVPAGRDAELAIREFHEHNVVRSEASGRTGKDIAADLIHASFEPERAAGLIERIEAPEASASFAFLEQVEAAALGKQLATETAETVAFVLVQLGPDQAAKILMALEAGRRTDVAAAIATMGTPAPEAGGVVADALRRQLRASTSRYAPIEADADDGHSLHVQPLVDIMNHAEPAAEGELLAALQVRDAHLADEVRAKMLAFEDLPRLQDRDLQQVLRGIDIAQIALALKGAGEDIANAVRSNMSERNRETLATEAAELGRVPKSQVEEARHLVVRALRELAGTTGLELKHEAADGEADAAGDASSEPEEEYVD